MNHRFELGERLQAMVATAQSFAPASLALADRRAAFLAHCRHYTKAPEPPLLVEDLRLDALSLRLYRPQQAAAANSWPTVLYLHGGGWNMGNLETHDWFAHALCKRLRVALVAVDYRLAPEHPYPAALQDVLSVWRALVNRQIHPALDPQRLLVCGDSAGGTLAAALCVALKEGGEAQPVGQALLYPVLTAGEYLPSAQECADAPLLTQASLRELIRDYLPNPSDRDTAQAMPLQGTDLSGLAPAFIGVAEFDPLRDHGREYSRRLNEAGVSSEFYFGAGLIHGCLRDDSIAEVSALYTALAAGIERLLARGGER